MKLFKQKINSGKAMMLASMAVGFIGLEIILFICVDRPLALFVQQLDVTHPDMIGFFHNITDYGKAVWYLWPCGIATIFSVFLSRAKDAPIHVRRLAGYVGVRAFFLFATIALSGIIADILKPLIGRARPVEFLRHGIYGFDTMTAAGFAWNSMPSGHATTAFTIGFALCMLYPRLRFLWLAYALLLAASRVMVDAHFLSDICAGAALGYLTVSLCLKHGMFRVINVIFPIDSLAATR